MTTGPRGPQDTGSTSGVGADAPERNMTMGGTAPGKEDAVGRAEELQDRVTETASDLADKGEEIADAGRERAADGIAEGARMLREQGGDGTAGAVADRAAEGMERTAQYLRERNSAEMWNDMETYVRDHPVQGIAGAVAAGFIVGRILR